jgi:hypothetical protein
MSSTRLISEAVNKLADNYIQKQLAESRSVLEEKGYSADEIERRLAQIKVESQIFLLPRLKKAFVAAVKDELAQTASEDKKVNRTLSP